MGRKLAGWMEDSAAGRKTFQHVWSCKLEVNAPLRCVMAGIIGMCSNFIMLRLPAWEVRPEARNQITVRVPHSHANRGLKSIAEVISSRSVIFPLL